MLVVYVFMLVFPISESDWVAVVVVDVFDADLTGNLSDNNALSVVLLTFYWVLGHNVHFFQFG